MPHCAATPPPNAGPLAASACLRAVMSWNVTKTLRSGWPGKDKEWASRSECPLTLCRKDAIHLDGLEHLAACKHLFELPTQRGEVKGAIPEIVEWDPLVSSRETPNMV